MDTQNEQTVRNMVETMNALQQSLKSLEVLTGCLSRELELRLELFQAEVKLWKKHDG